MKLIRNVHRQKQTFSKLSFHAYTSQPHPAASQLFSTYQLYNFSTSFSHRKDSDISSKFSVEEFLKEDKSTLDFNLPHNLDLSATELIPWYDYLKPSNWCLWSMENVKELFDLSWAPAIVITTLLIRTVMFYGNVLSIRNQKKTEFLMPKLQPMNEKLGECRKNRDLDGMREVQREKSEFNKKHGIKSWHTYVPAASMMLFFPSMVFSIRKMNDTVKYPDLVDGGILWFKDLSIPDPYYLLPLIVFICTCFSSEITYHYHTKYSKSVSKPLKPILRFFQPLATGVLALLIMPGWHSALFCYWVPNTFYTMLVSTLHIPKIGKHFSIPQKAPKTAEELEYEAKDVVQRLISDSKATENENNKDDSIQQKLEGFINRVQIYATDMKTRLIGSSSKKKAQSDQTQVVVTRDLIKKNQRSKHSKRQKR